MLYTYSWPFDPPGSRQGTGDAQMPLLTYFLDKINISRKKDSEGTSGRENWSRVGGAGGDISFMQIIETCPGEN